MTRFEQIKLLDNLESTGKLIKIKYHLSILEAEWQEHRRWFDYYTIDIIFAININDNINLDGRFVIVDLSLRYYLFSRKDDAMLYKLTFSGNI